MHKKITVIEVPSEAGTHWTGQYQAPKALREAGLQDKLSEIGYEVETITALKQPAKWRPAPILDGVRNEEQAVSVLRELHTFIKSNLQPDTIPLILGGDCSLTVASLSAVSHAQRPGFQMGVLYVDNDADLTVPAETSTPGSTGILDSMTLSNLTQRDGCVGSMRQFSKADGQPLVTNQNIVLFGLDLSQPRQDHFAFLLDNNYRCFSSGFVARDPARAAAEALTWLEPRGFDAIWLHFDVDVIDSGEFPLGNYPSYGGIGFEQVFEALDCFLGHCDLAGMSITEINPNNDATGEMARRFVDRLVQSFEVHKRKWT